MLVFLIIFITAIALGSVVRGLDAGVKVLSEVNIALAAALLLFIILVGPTLGILTGFFSNLVAYGQHLRRCRCPSGGRTRTSRRAGRRSTGRGGSAGRPSWACSSPASAAAAPCASS
jgi:hypothetical protein